MKPKKGKTKEEFRKENQKLKMSVRMLEAEKEYLKQKIDTLQNCLLKSNAELEEIKVTIRHHAELVQKIARDIIPSL